MIVKGRFTDRAVVDRPRLVPVKLQLGFQPSHGASGKQMPPPERGGGGGVLCGGGAVALRLPGQRERRDGGCDERDPPNLSSYNDLIQSRVPASSAKRRNLRFPRLRIPTASLRWGMNKKGRREKKGSPSLCVCVRFQLLVVSPRLIFHAGGPPQSVCVSSPRFSSPLFGPLPGGPRLHCGFLRSSAVQETESLMKLNPENGAPVRHEGKLAALVVCWLLGNGCLFSWNSMLTIEDYYVNLFPRYHPTRVLTLVYQPFALGTLAILAYREANINTRKRNLAGYLIFFISSLLVIVLDLGTSGKGGIGAFIGVCIISGAFGVADAHVQGGMVGDLSLMCPEFIQSFLAGLAASGALTSALRLISKAAFENSKDGLRKGAMLFFSVSCFFELLCVLLYAFVFPKLPIVKYYRSKAASEGSKTVSADLAAGGIQEIHDPDVESVKHLERLSNKQLFLQNMDYAADVFLIYALTLSIFPGFLSEDTGSHSLGSWYALVLIAMYNVWDLIGRYIPIVECLKIKHRKSLLIATLSRFLLIPAFYFTAKYGDQGWMIFLTSFLGLSNGYLTVCVLTAAPKGYKGPEQNALGNLLVLCLLAGIFSGVTLDWLWLIGKGW